MTKIHKFKIKTNTGVSIEYPIKEEMSVDEWIRFTNYINSIVRGVKQ